MAFKIKLCYDSFTNASDFTNKFDLSVLFYRITQSHQKNCPGSKIFKFCSEPLLRKSDEIKVVTEVLHLIGLEVEDKGVHRAVLIDNIRIRFSPKSCYTYLSLLHYIIRFEKVPIFTIFIKFLKIAK
jgi:hypothetical protein